MQNSSNGKANSGASMLYEKQVGESASAYHAFCAYRQMGPKRSLSELAKTLGSSKSTLEKHSVKWNWQARIHAWEVQAGNAACEADLSTISDMRKRHIGHALSLQTLGVEELQKL